MPIQVQLSSITFKSVTECTKYTRTLLTKVGVCNSVKNKDQNAYNFLLELCQRHPSANEKLKNQFDFKIHHDTINKKAFALDILNTDGTFTDISWIICCKGKPNSTKDDFNSALRQCISSQIWDFKCKTKHILHCEMCEDLLQDKHIDHVIHFQKLKDDFVKLHSIEIPSEYDEEPITYFRMFKSNDKWIGDSFYKYHEENATLRVVCPDCNLRRPKMDKCLIKFES